uniref:Uncharacterized protein n=1 Tax=Salmonella enterica subsp. salamae TaxID=59202 RepID=I3W417_SALER|nr:hypothetical protein [Salmonella enterica subsp. salamae]
MLRHNKSIPDTRYYPFFRLRDTKPPNAPKTLQAGSYYQ